MDRNIDEIIQSQHKMLVREGKAKADAINLKVVSAFQQNLERIKTWAPKQQYIDIEYISHAALLKHPEEELKKVEKFLNKKLDKKKMMSVIDKSLHREKVAS